MQATMITEIGYKYEQGFGITEDQTFILDSRLPQENNDRDDSDENVEKSFCGKGYIDFKHEVLNMFTSKVTSKLSYLVLVFQMKFTIYFVYGDDSCEHQLIWELDYRMHPEISSLGQQNCFEFIDGGNQFISGSSLGYICQWDIPSKQLMHAICVQPPNWTRPFNISNVRLNQMKNTKISLSYSSGKIVQTSVVNKQFELSCHSHLKDVLAFKMQKKPRRTTFDHRDLA